MVYTTHVEFPLFGKLTAADKEVSKEAISKALRAYRKVAFNLHLNHKGVWAPTQRVLNLDGGIVILRQDLKHPSPRLHVFRRQDGIPVIGGDSPELKRTCSKWSAPDGTLYNTLKEAIAGYTDRIEVLRQTDNGEWITILSFDDLPKFPTYFVALRSFAEWGGGLERLRCSPTVVRYLGDGSFEGWVSGWPDPTHWAPLPTVLAPRSV